MEPRALDPIIHQHARLQIMAALNRNRQASFTDLQRGLGLTAGNLASHAERLEQAGYIVSGRVLVDLSFEVHYRITPEGSEAFRTYLARLRALVEEATASPEPSAGPEVRVPQAQEPRRRDTGIHAHDRPEPPF